MRFGKLRGSSVMRLAVGGECKGHTPTTAFWPAHLRATPSRADGFCSPEGYRLWAALSANKTQRTRAAGSQSGQGPALTQSAPDNPLHPSLSGPVAVIQLRRGGFFMRGHMLDPVATACVDFLEDGEVDMQYEVPEEAREAMANALRILAALIEDDEEDEVMH